jgi:hypothetical protein
MRWREDSGEEGMSDASLCWGVLKDHLEEDGDEVTQAT